MKIVSFPDNFKDRLISKFSQMLDSGQIAEGNYYNAEDEYIPGKKSVPVATWGAAYISLLSFYKYEKKKKCVILQSNTMRGVYSASRFMDMKVYVADSSSEPGFLSMDYKSCSKVIDSLKKQKMIDQTILVYSIIGGYLSNDYFKIETLCRTNNIPIIIDMAHGHYLNKIIETKYAVLAFSFYATKILPSGEGGLISTNDDKIFNWVKKFLMYDRFDYSLEVGVNLRTNELTSYFIHTLLTDDKLKYYFLDRRVKIADQYRDECIKKKINFLDYKNALDYNGYKFVIFDEFDIVSQKSNLLCRHGQTSPVFNFDIINKKKILTHWCPPTYPSLNKMK